MWRLIWRPALFFLLPFAVYALFLILRRTAPFARHHWGRGIVSTLTLAGLFAAVLGVFLMGVLAQRHFGPYVPAHIENGRVVPGQMQ
jgi:Family of unknown function (DUF6111)